MGGPAGMVGLGGGASGTGFAGPEGAAGLLDPTNQQNIENSSQGTQNSLGGQQALLSALQQQNGLGNQNQVYGQLQGVANGTGPNPAQTQLAQATGANVAQQGALQAGQRGAGANVGLMARQIGAQGAATQQNAAGQAANLQANQSLNAINAAGQMANTQAANQVGQTNANTQAELQRQQNLMGAQGAFNSAMVSNQASVNSANAGLAQTGMQGQQKVAGGIMGGIGGALGLAQGGMVPRMAGGGTASDSSAYSGAASKFGKFLKGAGAAMSSAPAAAPGAATTAPSDPLEAGMSKLTSGLIGALKGGPGQGKPVDQNYSQVPGASGLTAGTGLPQEQSPYAQSPGAGGLTSGAFPAASMTDPMMAKGGRVDIMVSPGEKILPPGAVEKVKKGADPMKVGETVPGKPKVGGAKNSYSNDTVPKKAAVGTVVVPRSATKSKNPSKNSEKFLAAIIANRKKR